MPKQKNEERKMIRFGLILKMARSYSNYITQLDVARELGVTQSLIAQLETGKISNPSEELMQNLAKIYKIRYVDLIAEFVYEKYGVDLIENEPKYLADEFSKRASDSIRNELAKK